MPPTDTFTPIPTDTPTPLPVLQAQVPPSWIAGDCTIGAVCKQATYEVVTITDAGPGPVLGPIGGKLQTGAYFTIGSQSTCPSISSLAQGATCTFYIQLGSPASTPNGAPTCVISPASDILQVTGQAANSPLAVPISFDTICPTATPTPLPANMKVTQPATWTYIACTSLIFSCPSQYGGYYTMNLQVTNTGPGAIAGPIHGTVISGNTADFEALPTAAASTCESSSSLASGSSCTLQVLYIGQGCPSTPESVVYEVTGAAVNSPQDTTLNDPHNCPVIQ